jgi:hypothetical protein
VLRLTLLAPDIVEAVLNGRQAIEAGLPALLEPMSSIWEGQRLTLAGPAEPSS